MLIYCLYKYVMNICWLPKRNFCLPPKLHTSPLVVRLWTNNKNNGNSHNYNNNSIHDGK